MLRVGQGLARPTAGQALGGLRNKHERLESECLCQIVLRLQRSRIDGAWGGSVIISGRGKASPARRSDLQFVSRIKVNRAAEGVESVLIDALPIEHDFVDGAGITTE